MKTFKLCDTWISTGLIIIFTLYGLGTGDARFLTGYFVVGGWHIISMLVHQYQHCFTYKGGARFYYHRIVLLLAIATLLGFAWPPLLMLTLYLLLFASPIMAAFYTSLCFKETYYKMQRPLAALK